MYLRIIFLFMVGLLLGGCSLKEMQYGETKPHISHTTLNGSNIYVWSPKNTAALIDSSGNACIQGAALFHAKNAELDISDSILSLLKKPNPTTADKSNLIAFKIANEMKSLRNNSERISYLSVGMFGLCQLFANGTISEAAHIKLLTKLFDTSSKLTNPVLDIEKLIKKEEQKIEKPVLTTVTN